MPNVKLPFDNLAMFSVDPLHSVSPYLLTAVLSVMLISAMATVFSSSSIASALYLVVHLLGVACLFALLGAHFLALAQVIVYAGAIMVLFLFVVMLLNSKLEPSGSRWFSIVFGGLSVVLFLLIISSKRSYFISKSQTDYVDVFGSASAIGRLLFNEYTFIFEILSLVLLIGLTGATALARKHRQDSLVNNNSKDK
jgi:NADH-quinone oxidoreductase subunit J